MNDLIAKLEAATGPSRALDALIYVELNPGRITHPKLPAGYTITDLGNPVSNNNMASSSYISVRRGPAPNYTGSIDTALTLLDRPKKYDDMVRTWAPQITIMYSGEAKVSIAETGVGIIVQELRAPTAALALCIAGMKARQYGGVR